jgi:hypothetical protein
MHFRSYFVYSLSFIVFFSGCAKETTSRVNTTSNSSSQTTIASDELTINDEFDQAADDAVMVICNHATSIPGATVDTSQIGVGVIEIDYYGQETDGTKTRSGADSIHLKMISGHLVNWGTAGNNATITFGTVNSPGYEVIYSNNNTSLQLRGGATLTNVSGGLFPTITPADSLKEHIRANISFTFNDNVAVITLYQWSLNQLRTFWLAPSPSINILTAYNQGDTTLNGVSNVGTWGTTRYNNSFYSVINSTITQNLLFFSYNPVSGSENIEGIPEPITSTYGVNNQGSVITSGTPYGFSITWINSGGQATAVVPYYF